MKATKSLQTITWIVFSIFLCNTIVGQTNKEILQQLKDGVLLVQLNTEKKKIEKLRELGLEEQAVSLEQELKREHYEIVQAFTQAFDFCPAYFFYAEDADEIAKGNIKPIIRDENLSLIEIDPPSYLIARFGYTPDRSIPGLMLFNQNLEYLDGYFPGFVSKNIIPLIFVRSKSKMIQLLNSKLHNYYNSL